MARPLRVLVVEDDERVRTLIRDVLGADAEVEGVADVEHARALLARPRRRRLDLAIVDCVLPGPQGPGRRGIELIGELHTALPALPILAITGAGHAPSLVVDAFAQGARDVLRKPFGVDELRAAVRRLTARGGRRAPGRPSASRAGVARVLTFLAEHSEQPASLDTLARVAVMSRSHLSRTFRSAVGLPLRVYVRNLRLERAQHLLLASPRPSLTDVALEAGFYDLPHFDKAFRERFGISPSEFLRRHELQRVDARRKAGRRRA
ncbi:MAG TPA: helix-turn-helix domain-containing protein [Terriglobales bacterium]|nr:helix-turn-helix domain-containing protein [Terriglobales bacterium]